MKDSFNIQLLVPQRKDDCTVLRIRGDGSITVEIDRPGRDSSPRLLPVDKTTPQYSDFVQCDTIVSGSGPTLKHTLSVAVRLFRLQGLLPKSLS